MATCKSYTFTEVALYAPKPVKRKPIGLTETRSTYAASGGNNDCLRKKINAVDEVVPASLRRQQAVVWAKRP